MRHEGRKAIHPRVGRVWLRATRAHQPNRHKQGRIWFENGGYDLNTVINACNYHFTFDQTRDERTIRMKTVPDKFKRESQALKAQRGLLPDGSEQGSEEKTRMSRSTALTGLGREARVLAGIPHREYDAAPRLHGGMGCRSPQPAPMLADLWNNKRGLWVGCTGCRTRYTTETTIGSRSRPTWIMI